MRTEPIIFKFRDAGNGFWISELAPSLVTLGIYIIVDTNDTKGQIALMRDRQVCGCAAPLQCPSAASQSPASDAPPCKEAKTVREAVDVFSFNDAPSFDLLIYGMRNSLGVYLDALDCYSRAAMECLAESEWEISAVRHSQKKD